MSVYKCKYFKIQELVCNHVMQSYSEEQIWSFLDEDLKKTLDIIREILGVPLTINQPKMKVYQRGLRCHLCNLVQNNLVLRIVLIKIVVVTDKNRFHLKYSLVLQEKVIEIELGGIKNFNINSLCLVFA